MKDNFYRADDLASELECSSRKIRNVAKTLHVGINLGGRAGYRFSEADRAKIHESMRPMAPIPARRKRRAA